MFEIEVDRFNALLMITGTGFWTTSTVHDFLNAEREAIADLGVPVSELLILFDASGFSVQSDEVIALLRNTENPLYNAKRGAFVTPPGFGLMQIRLGTTKPHIGIFGHRAEAWHYLLAA